MSSDPDVATWAGAYDGPVVDDLELHTYEDGAVLRADGTIVVLPTPPDEVTTEYGVFNDAEVWEALFASGELPEALRDVLLDRPLYGSEVLREVVQHARLTNEERANRGQLDKVGYVVVRERTVTRSRWTEVSRDEQAASIGEF